MEDGGLDYEDREFKNVEEIHVNDVDVKGNEVFLKTLFF
uniref:Uncharacterized protein n=1 Tax=Vitis vinifera TaxID=29760 RepID=F6GUG2_VITVI